LLRRDSEKVVLFRNPLVDRLTWPFVFSSCSKIKIIILHFKVQKIPINFCNQKLF